MNYKLIKPIKYHYISKVWVSIIEKRSVLIASVKKYLEEHPNFSAIMWTIIFLLGIPSISFLIYNLLKYLNLISGFLVFLLIVLLASFLLEMIRISLYTTLTHAFAVLGSAFISIAQLMFWIVWSLIAAQWLITVFFGNKQTNTLAQLSLLAVSSVICMVIYIIVIQIVLRTLMKKVYFRFNNILNNRTDQGPIKYLLDPKTRGSKEISDLQKARSLLEKIATFTLFFYAILSGLVNTKIKNIVDVISDPYALHVFVLSLAIYSYTAIFNIPGLDNDHNE
ncbi:hypothetical protein [Domibacillus indicus]|uniref:hypothetical protein n=1 Tax=Domibacillus indicus TaxID=1437523 RepID=UPI000617D905|nr:hypothetical protein [Domibacillus indicus]